MADYTSRVIIPSFLSLNFLNLCSKVPVKFAGSYKSLALALNSWSDTDPLLSLSIYWNC